MPWGLLLKAGPYLLIVLALAWGGWERLGRITCERDVAAAVAEAQAKVLAFKEADDAKTKALSDAHAAEVARIRGENNARESSIRRAASSLGCLDSPAYRAFIGGLQPKPAPQASPRASGSPVRIDPPVPK